MLSGKDRDAIADLPTSNRVANGISLVEVDWDRGKDNSDIRPCQSLNAAVNVTISECEMAMALLNGLPEECNALISALDAIDEDETKLRFEFIKTRIMQEEQRITMRSKSAIAKSESAALLSNQPARSVQQSSNDRNERRRPYCNYCKRLGHIESKCWTKFPNLNPRNKTKLTSKPALFASQSDEDPRLPHG